MYIKLKEVRLARRMTLKELSKLSGISIDTLSGIETNRVDCRISTLCKIAIALGVTLCQLVDCEKMKNYNFIEYDKTMS